MTGQRIALMVDGDNISAVHATKIFAQARALGRVDIARVYLGAHQTEWHSAAGYRAMFAGAGKNAADVLLCIDAIELALLEEIKTFVIATSDGDFSHLGLRLRERGLHVLGVGEKKAPQSFRLACSALTQLHCEPKAAQKCEVTAPPCGLTEFDRNIRSMIAAHSNGGKGIRIVDLAPKMSMAHGTRISAYPERSWRSYLTKRPALFDVDPRGPDAMVRYRTAGFATAPA
tara:strand:- start:2360 stop:3049 length:690 start_codon:yes stop_codon:yes gene_type:complete